MAESERGIIRVHSNHSTLHNSKDGERDLEAGPSDPKTSSRLDTFEQSSERKEEAEDASSDYSSSSPGLSNLQPITTVESKNIIVFEAEDPGNPFNWSTLWKAFYVFTGALTVLNSTLGSSLPSGDILEIAKHFDITIDAQLVLPISIFLIGYVLGPLLFSPLSESYGRQYIMLSTFAGYTIFSLAICFSPNFAAFIIFRLFQGIFASSPISIVGGIYADLYNNPVHRGRAMALFMTATTFGPLIGPIMSGYLGTYSWRWPFWAALMVCGISWIPLIMLPETYGPTILSRRAKKIRKQNPGFAVYAAIDTENKSTRELITVVLARPFRMLFCEAIVGFSSLYLSIVYAVFYMFFQVYPIVYPGIYGFSYGEEGLAFLPLGVGAVTACIIYLFWDHILQKAKARDAEWARREEYRRLPLGCIGGPFFAIGMFWIGWSSRASVHWIVPMLGGIPLGIGFLLLFMSLINYIVDAYEVYAASGLAATSCSRSLFGAVLPFAAGPMFQALGVAWACSLLGFVSIALCFIPFVFIKYGDKLRSKSKFCQELQEKKKTDEAAAERRRLRQQQRQGEEHEKIEDKL